MNHGSPVSTYQWCSKTDESASLSPVSPLSPLKQKIGRTAVLGNARSLQTPVILVITPQSGRESPNLWINPMDQERLTKQLRNIRAAPRCGARTRAGGTCQCPAIRGRRRCRIHGGLSPGAPCGEKNGNFKEGFFTCEAVSERKWVRDLIDTYAKEKDK